MSTSKRRSYPRVCVDIFLQIERTAIFHPRTDATTNSFDGTLVFPTNYWTLACSMFTDFLPLCSVITLTVNISGVLRGSFKSFGMQVTAQPTCQLSRGRYGIIGVCCHFEQSLPISPLQSDTHGVLQVSQRGKRIMRLLLYSAGLA